MIGSAIHFDHIRGHIVQGNQIICLNVRLVPSIVKYNDAISASQALSSQIRSLASAYLLTTGLLNRACMIAD